MAAVAGVVPVVAGGYSSINATYGLLDGPGVSMMDGLFESPMKRVGGNDFAVCIGFRGWANVYFDKFRVYWAAGPGYAAGNGGTLVFKILPDDGTGNSPNEAAAALGTVTYTPATNGMSGGYYPGMSQGFYELTMSHVTKMTPGTQYYLVGVNTDASPATNWSTFDCQRSQNQNGRVNRYLEPVSGRVLRGTRVGGSGPFTWQDVTTNPYNDSGNNVYFSPIAQFKGDDGSTCPGIYGITETGNVDSRWFQLTSGQKMCERRTQVAQTWGGISAMLGTSTGGSLQIDVYNGATLIDTFTKALSANFSQVNPYGYNQAILPWVDMDRLISVPNGTIDVIFTVLSGTWYFPTQQNGKTYGFTVPSIPNSYSRWFDGSVWRATYRYGHTTDNPNTDENMRMVVSLATNSTGNSSTWTVNGFVQPRSAQIAMSAAIAAAAVGGKRAAGLKVLTDLAGAAGIALEFHDPSTTNVHTQNFAGAKTASLGKVTYPVTPTSITSPAAMDIDAAGCFAVFKAVNNSWRVPVVLGRAGLGARLSNDLSVPVGVTWGAGNVSLALDPTLDDVVVPPTAPVQVWPASKVFLDMQIQPLNATDLMFRGTSNTVLNAGGSAMALPNGIAIAELYNRTGISAANLARGSNYFGVPLSQMAFTDSIVPWLWSYMSKSSTSTASTIQSAYMQVWAFSASQAKWVLLQLSCPTGNEELQNGGQSGRTAEIRLDNDPIRGIGQLYMVDGCFYEQWPNNGVLPFYVPTFDVLPYTDLKHFACGVCVRAVGPDKGNMKVGIQLGYDMYNRTYRAQNNNFVFDDVGPPPVFSPFYAGGATSNWRFADNSGAWDLITCCAVTPQYNMGQSQYRPPFANYTGNNPYALQPHCMSLADYNANPVPWILPA